MFREHHAHEPRLRDDVFELPCKFPVWSVIIYTGTQRDLSDSRHGAMDAGSEANESGASYIACNIVFCFGEAKRQAAAPTGQAHESNQSSRVASRH